MTIDPHDEYGERLRRVLHAEVDSIVPSADGLERIRVRAEKRRLRRAFLSVWWLKPALAAFGAVAVAGSAAVAAPLLQQVGGERGMRPVAPGAASTSTGGQETPTRGSEPPDTRDPSIDPTLEHSATTEEPGGPFTIVRCYPLPDESETTAKKARSPEPSTSPSPSSTLSPTPSEGPSCAPGSTPTATVTMTPSPTPSDCVSKDENSRNGESSECPSPTPSEPSTSPSP